MKTSVELGHCGVSRRSRLHFRRSGMTGRRREAGDTDRRFLSP